MIEAFGRLRGATRLRIWGRPREQFTSSLRGIANVLPGDAASRVEWMGEYENEQIVAEVFNRVDAIVVPSVWTENSPLVIHEAQQARLPVITADVGGMAEYVHHEVNGLLFTHRNPAALATSMQRLIDEPALAQRLGSQGYLYSESGDVPSLSEHRHAVEAIYAQAIHRHAPMQPTTDTGPWRITFDTNPDDCNLKCIMCEEHSPHSRLQLDRRAAGKPKRRMDVALIRKVVEDCHDRGLQEIIPSTMGEPLLYKYFDEILALCTEFGVKLNLTTNGTFPGRGPAEWGELIAPVASDVKISINGATAATQECIMHGSDLEAVIENVRRFIAVRDRVAREEKNYCRVTFQTTFLDNNVDELPDLVRLAASLGVDRVKGHHLWVHFTQIDGLSMRRSRGSVERWNAVVKETQRATDENRLPDGRAVVLENIHTIDPDAIEDLAPGGECPFLGREAWVGAEGRFDPCCAPDALRRTLGEFGNLKDHSLISIWESQEYRALRDGYMEHQLCQTCNMRRPTNRQATSM